MPKKQLLTLSPHEGECLGKTLPKKKQSTDWAPKTELTKTKKPSRIVEVYSIGRPLVIEESSQVKSINSIYKIRISATNGCSHRCCRHCCNDSKLQLLLENHFCLMYELFMQHCCNGRISAKLRTNNRNRCPKLIT